MDQIREVGMEALCDGITKRYFLRTVKFSNFAANKDEHKSMRRKKAGPRSGKSD